MTRKESARIARQEAILTSLGFTQEEAESLRRISMALRRWYELECGDSNSYGAWAIERDETTDKPYMVWQRYAPGKNQACYTTRTRIPDREKGALKRLAKIIGRRNGADYVKRYGSQGLLSTYIQTDPRGAALYILRPGDVPAGADVSGYYSRGICVY